MGIFDIFTNDSAKQAAEKNAALYQQYGSQANAALGQYGTQAGDIFSNYGTQAGKLYSDLGTTGDQYLTQYGGQATGALDTGLANSRAAYGNARTAAQGQISAYDPLAALGSKYGQATTLYQDALGVNGPEGVARAQAAFQTGPGYNFAVNQATDAAARKAASLGMANSGNALDEIRNRAQGFARQEYNNYLSNLAGFVNPELSATSGAASGRAGGFNTLAGIYGQEAGNETNDAVRRAALLTDLGNARTNLASNVTGAQAGVLGNVSAAQAQLLKDIAQGRIGIAGNVTGGQASANNAEAQAAQQGSANFWNALASLGGSAIKGFYGQPRAA